MEVELLRGIIQESSLAYLKFQANKNHNKYEDIKIINFNKAFTKIIDSKEDKIDSGFIKDLILNNDMNLDKLLNIAHNDKVLKTITFVKELNKNIKIDIHSGENHEFHCVFSPLDRNTNELCTTLKKSPFASWIKDRNGKYIDVNAKYEELVNKGYYDVIGKTDFEIWSKEYALKYKEQDNIVLNQNTLQTYDEYLETYENNRRYFRTSKWPFVDENNVIIGTMGIAIEITDTIQVQETIRKNDEIFWELANNIDDIIFTRDENNLLYISPSFEKYHGFKPDESLKNIESWYSFWDKVEFTEPPKEYSHRGITIDTYKVTRDENEKWLTCKSFPIYDEHGNITKRIGIVSDITTSKKIQEELEQLRLDFFANLSHELRTPINLILSSLEVVKIRLDRLKSEDYDYFEKYLGIINQNGLRLLKLVNNLIDTTKIDSGHFSYNPQNYDIINFVENICMSVSDFIEQKGMNIVFDTDTEEKIISFDLDNMERIILNLLSNAIKFNKNNGIIEVKISCKDKVCISVKDQGIGIPNDMIDNIFERFEQVKNNNKKDVEGSGIGLSLVKSLVNMHGGNISVNSELGNGSEFMVILPDTTIEWESTEETVQNYNNVNMMKVEFSDIYS